MNNMKPVVNDKKTTLTHDFIKGHEYEVVVRAVGPDGTEQAMEIAARNTVVIAGKLAVPSSPQTLTTAGLINSVGLSWTNPLDYDFDHMEVWRSTINDRTLTALLVKIAEVKGITYTDALGIPNTTRYYWIRAVNTSGVSSDYYPNLVSGISGRSVGVTATNIDDFSVTATKLFLKTVVLTNDTWTNNSPAAGSIAWNAHQIVFNGATYPISAGNTASTYIYWVISSTVYSTSATHPVLGTTGFMVAINTSGTHTLVWNSSANMVIGNAYIVDLLADKILAGTITGSTLQTAVSGQRVVIAAADNTLRFHTATVSNVILMDDTVSGSRPGMKVTDATNGCTIQLIKDANNQTHLFEHQVFQRTDTNGPQIWASNVNTGANNRLFYAQGDAGESGTASGLLYVGGINTSPFILKFSVDYDGVINTLGGIEVAGTTIVDSSRNLTNIGAVGCGAITSTGNIIAQGGRFTGGVNDATFGVMTLYGDNNTTGPSIYMYNAANEDAEEYWRQFPDGTDYYLGPASDFDAFIFGNAGDFTAAGVVDAVGGFADNGTPGIDTTFLNGDGDVVTVAGGIITNIT